MQNEWQALLPAAHWLNLVVHEKGDAEPIGESVTPRTAFSAQLFLAHLSDGPSRKRACGCGIYS